jgi:tetratricopeptide (TPR) repeat protein/TolB-like protein
MGFYAAAFIVVAIVARLLVTTQGLPEWVFAGALIVMALGFPVLLFTGYTQYMARQIANATPTLTPNGSVVRATPRGTMAHLAVKASPHVTWRRAARGGIAAITVFALLVVGFLVLRVLGIGPAGSLLASGKLNAQDRVLVAAFDAASKDSALGDVLSEAVRTNLSQSRAVNVVSTSNLVAALGRMKRKPTTRVDLALAREIAVREGIKAVVTGSVTSAGAGYIITARLVSAQSGDELAVFRESASDAGEIIPAVDRLTRGLRGKIGESLRSVSHAPALAQVTTPSLDALRAFAAGLRANEVEGNDTKAIPLYEEAIAKDSDFAAAYVQLAYSLGNLRLYGPRRDSMLEKAFRLRERLPEGERYGVEGAYWMQNDRPKAIAAFERAVAVDSFDTDVLNSLAILYTGIRDYPRAERAYRRAVLLEPENGIIMANYTSELVTAGKLGTADSMIRVIHDRKIPYPTGRREIDLLYFRGNVDSAEALARALSGSANPAIGLSSLAFLRAITAARGRLREADGVAAELETRNAARGVKPSIFERPLDAAFNDAWLRDQNARAVARVDELLRTHSPAGPEQDHVYFDAARVYAMAGAPDRARAMVTKFGYARRDSAQRRRWESTSVMTEGEIALAEHRTQDAIRLFRQSDVSGDGLPSGCTFCLPGLLGLAYDQANMADSTIANLERYLATPNTGRVFTDAWLMAPTHKRLGELYEARGDKTRALSHYTTFVSLWRHADPELQAKVADVRARIDHLQRATGR